MTRTTAALLLDQAETKSPRRVATVHQYAAISPNQQLCDGNQKSAAFSCPTVNYSGETINPLQYGANTEIFKHHPTPATPHLN